MNVSTACIWTFGFNKTAELVVCSRCCWMLFWTRKGIRVLVLHFFVGEGLLFFLVFLRYLKRLISCHLKLSCLSGTLVLNGKTPFQSQVWTCGYLASLLSSSSSSFTCLLAWYLHIICEKKGPLLMWTSQGKPSTGILHPYWKGEEHKWFTFAIYWLRSVIKDSPP